MASLARTVTIPTRYGVAIKPFPSKDPGDVLEYTLDAADWLSDSGHVLEACEIRADPTLTVTGEALVGDGNSPTRVTALVGGGVAGLVPIIRYALTTTGGNTLIVGVLMPVVLRAPASLPPIDTTLPANAVTYGGQAVTYGGQIITYGA